MGSEMCIRDRHAVVLLDHALGDGVRKLQEPVVELAEVAEDERLYDPVSLLVDEVALAPALRVVQVVVAARTAAALRVRVGALRAGGPRPGRRRAACGGTQCARLCLFWIRARIRAAVENSCSEHISDPKETNGKFMNSTPPFWDLSRESWDARSDP